MEELIVLMSSVLQERAHFRFTSSPLLDLCWLSDGRYDAFYGMSFLTNKLHIIKTLLLEAKVHYSTVSSQQSFLSKDSLIVANKNFIIF